MKKIFIPAKSRLKVGKLDIEKISEKLPKTIALAYSVQFREFALKVKEILSKTHNILGIIQVLGCTKPRLHKDVEAILLVGSGKFHGGGLAFETKLPVYVFSDRILERVPNEYIISLEKKHKAEKLKFFNSDNIGVIISTKPGQERLERALKLKEKFTNKNFYFFLDHTLDIRQLENFNVGSWVNTACPRLDYDRSFLNLTEVEELNT